MVRGKIESARLILSWRQLKDIPKNLNLYSNQTGKTK